MLQQKWKFQIIEAEFTKEGWTVGTITLYLFLKIELKKTDQFNPDINDKSNLIDYKQKTWSYIILK